MVFDPDARAVVDMIRMAGRPSFDQLTPAEAREAWAIVETELSSFAKTMAARAAVPAIVSLRGRFELVREQVLADVVWNIRRFRPDVIVLRFSGTPRDGHGHHQASAILGKEAFIRARHRDRT